MESALPDVHWLARSLKEPTAFELIFDRHFDAIYGYLHRRVGRDLAEELAAETFTLAFERRSSCRASGSVLPWLYGIATNLASQRWRGERRRLRAYGRSGVDGWVAYDDEVVARVDGSALRARLACALAEMRPRALPESTSETVDCDTPARRATSTLVTRGGALMSAILGRWTNSSSSVARNSSLFPSRWCGMRRADTSA